MGGEVGLRRGEPGSLALALAMTTMRGTVAEEEGALKFNCSWALHAPYGPEYSTAPAIRRDDETTTLRVSTCGYDASESPHCIKSATVPCIHPYSIQGADNGMPIKVRLLYCTGVVVRHPTADSLPSVIISTGCQPCFHSLALDYGRKQKGGFRQEDSHGFQYLCASPPPSHNRPRRPRAEHTTCDDLKTTRL